MSLLYHFSLKNGKLLLLVVTACFVVCASNLSKKVNYFSIMMSLIFLHLPKITCHNLYGKRGRPQLFISIYVRSESSERKILWKISKNSWSKTVDQSKSLGCTLWILEHWRNTIRVSFRSRSIFLSCASYCELFAARYGCLCISAHIRVTCNVNWRR